MLSVGEGVGCLEETDTQGLPPGHIAFLDTRDRAVIVGDAFQTLGGVAVSGTIKPLFPLPALATWHKGLALESARKLLALQPSMLDVGHGRMLSQPQAAIERAIRVMERSLAKEERKLPHVAEGLAGVARQLVEAGWAVLAPYRLSEEVAIHAIRSLRSIVQGFISLEMAGGFRMPVDLDASFHWLINVFVAGVDRPTVTGGQKYGATEQ